MPLFFVFFFFNDTATTEIYPLSLHDPLPICVQGHLAGDQRDAFRAVDQAEHNAAAVSNGRATTQIGQDRKSTRLNSSHVRISYAVFCLKKKKHRKNIA